MIYTQIQANLVKKMNSSSKVKNKKQTNIRY